jgi:hypothetical protein
MAVPAWYPVALCVTLSTIRQFTHSLSSVTKHWSFAATNKLCPMIHRCPDELCVASRWGVRPPCNLPKKTSFTDGAEVHRTPHTAQSTTYSYTLGAAKELAATRRPKLESMHLSS